MSTRSDHFRNRVEAAVVGLLLAAPVIGPVWAAEVWVTNMQGANVQVIDADTLEVLATIPADKGAHNVTFSRDGSLALIANVAANNVSIIDAEARKVMATVPAGDRAHEVSISPDAKLAASSNVGTDYVTLIDVAAGAPIKDVKTGDGAP